MVNLRSRFQTPRVLLLVAALVGSQLFAQTIPASADQIDGTFSTVVDQQGRLHTWGSNSTSLGLLGNYPSSSSSMSNPVRVWTDANTGSTGSFVKVATGNGHTIAIDTAGELFSWGKNDKGQVGHAGNGSDQPFMRPVSTSFNSSPTAIAGKTFVDVAAGEKFSIALDLEGNIYSWGANDQGQLGDGTQDGLSDTTADLVVMPTLPAGVTFTSISAGKDFAVAVASNGHLYTWGAGEKMGVAGNTTDYLVPTKLAFFDDKPVSQVASSTRHTVVLTQSGDIWVFGDASAANNEYAWGTGSANVTTSAPQAISTTIAYVNSSGTKTSFLKPVDLTFTSISAGPHLSAALDSKGQLYVWGGGFFNNPDDGTSWVFAYNRLDYAPTETKGHYFPTLINVSNVAFDGNYSSWQPLLSFEKVELGLNRALGVTSSGSLYSWGKASSANTGELGLGSTASTDVPTQITGGTLSGALVSTSLFTNETPLGLKVQTVASNEPFQLGIRDGNWASDYSSTTRISCIADLNIYWGDGTQSTISRASQSSPSSTNSAAWIADFTHTYSSAGTYNISVFAGPTNTCNSMQNVGNLPGTARNEDLQLLSVGSWGFIHNIYEIFRSKTNLVSVPSTLPQGTTSLSNLFNGATAFNDSRISSWDTSNVTNMSSTFYGATLFNKPIDSWDTSNVTRMDSMFRGASSFNQNLNAWNTSNVVDMTSMFYDASVFNGSIGNWDTSQVTSMQGMFYQANAFNQPLGNWDTSNVTTMQTMFTWASVFNQPIGNWDTSKVTSMVGMFERATLFNQPIGSWDTSNVTTMAQMFYYASNFNQNINSDTQAGTWNTSKVTNMSKMFYYASNFNQPVGNWDTSEVTNMAELFSRATLFNQPIGNWSTSKVTNMTSMFLAASAFNQDIGDWNTSNVTSFRSMFASATSFNQDIGDWNTSRGTDMSSMFSTATVFNHDISDWDTSAVLDMSFMLSSARDFNKPVGSWNTSSVTNMFGMFRFTDSFNQDINYNAAANTWNTSNVTDMRDMFYDATAFNKDIGLWNTSSVTQMSRMFELASSFNQDINSDVVNNAWDVSNVTTMAGMFKNANKFAYCLNWDLTGKTTTDMFNVAYGTAVSNCADLLFDEQDGTAVPDLLDYKLGFTLPPLPNTSLAGDTFLGWGLSATGCATNAPTSMSVDPTNLYAKWESDCGLVLSVEPSAGNLTSILPIGEVGCFLHVSIDWGDGSAVQTVSINPLTVPGGFPTKTYASAGSYTISVVPLSNNTCSSYGSSDSGVQTSNGMITAVGSFPQWIDDYTNAFSGAVNLTSVPASLPGGVTSTAGMFAGATSFNQDISGWSTASVTDMSNMFNGATAFNQDICAWSTASVTNMSNMFAGATSFNKDISCWSTANVTDMSNMFSGATSFDQPLGTWDTSSVTDFSGMFNGAAAFDQSIGTWNTGSATDMSNMFFGAGAFNQNVSAWDVSDVLDFSGMFDGPNDTTVLGYCLGWTIPAGATVTDMYGSSYDPTNCATIEFEVNGGSAVASFDYQASGFNLQTPPTSTKAGVTLTGWSLSASDCQAVTFPLAGPFSDPTKLYAVWSDCQVPQASSGSAPYTGPIVRSIGGKSGQLETQIGSRVRLDLENTSGLTQVLVNGVPAEIVVNEAGEVIFIVPVGVQLGQNDITLVTDSGRLTVQDAIVIKDLTTAAESASDVCTVQGPNAWTKRVSRDSAKLYIKCGDVGTAYRVEVQIGSGSFTTVITRTPSSAADPRQVFNDFGRYFVRSVSIYDRLRIRIYGDRELLWQVVYNLQSWSRQ